jgi:dihydroorotate dehydrogenase
VRRAWLQVYKGPELIPQMKAELLRCLQADGFASVEEAIGADHR